MFSFPVLKEAPKVLEKSGLPSLMLFARPFCVTCSEARPGSGKQLEDLVVDLKDWLLAAE